MVDIKTAMAAAREAVQDLVEVGPNADPPVCRIMDYGKYKYEQKKKAHEGGRKHRVSQVKEVRLRCKTDLHDLEHKLRQAREFLDTGDKVLLTVRFRGREIVHPELGYQILRDICERMSDCAVVEREPKMEGRRMSALLSPKQKGTRDAKEQDAQRSQETDKS